MHKFSLFITIVCPEQNENPGEWSINPLTTTDQMVAYATRFLAARLKKYVWSAALQAATILVAMASEKNIWRPKFWRKSPIGDQQSKKETYLKKYQ